MTETSDWQVSNDAAVLMGFITLYRTRTAASRRGESAV
jgi:hypothetical protein